jgi:hypothetical protein
MPPPVPPSLAPSSVKTFGIIHLVLAALGVINALWGFASKWFTGLFLDAKDPTTAAQLRYQEELYWFTLVASGMALALAALLLVAGLKLVRQKPDGVAWSNRYAWTSIAFKMVTLVITVAYVLPLTNRMMEEIMSATPGMPAGAAGTMGGIMKGVTSVASVIGPVISCTYPALALYFLSRPPVKAWASR